MAQTEADLSRQFQAGGYQISSTPTSDGKHETIWVKGRTMVRVEISMRDSDVTVQESVLLYESPE